METAMHSVGQEGVDTDVLNEDQKRRSIEMIEERVLSFFESSKDFRVSDEFANARIGIIVSQEIEAARKACSHIGQSQFSSIPVATPDSKAVQNVKTRAAEMLAAWKKGDV